MLGFYMSRFACLGMVILPVFLSNVGESFAGMSKSLFNQGAFKTANIFIPKNHKSQTVTYLVAARDEKIQDCIRLGNCKD
jgi:hypothetical protein